ncbi:hypothetical protein BDN72DRAFT_902521 [Pluteus cervinus]|uniref:Uncharacterized protein n=1 Tax=Pluteus cervinus TaxID=181527 RepID=A0ACD3ABP2_9AGAR|nr:hypothetical protein BDN72DRAFT_902521 [Pluteus cervinus]
MRFTSYITIALTFVGATLALPVAKRSASDIESALSTIASDLVGLDSAAVAYPAGGSLIDALSIDIKVNSLGSDVSAATTAVKSVTSLSEADGQAILTAVQGYFSVASDIMQQLVTKKSGFTSLPIPGIEGIILQGIQSMADNFNALGSSLVAIAPADLQATANTILQAITPVFAPAIAAYSS